MEQISVNRREIWIAKVPFSDMSSSKIRPVLILSKNSYNETNPDVVGAAITTHIDREYTIQLSEKDFDKHSLMDQSAVRFDGLLKIDKILLHKRVARVSEDFRKKVIGKIIEFLD
jgi:mRNA interferase MazF